MDYFEYFNTLYYKSDADIYNLLKSCLIRDHFGYYVNEKYIQALYDRAMDRNPKIFYDALQDALITIHNWSFKMSETKVIEIKRLDYLSDYEIRELVATIGAAKKNPPLDLSNPQRSAITEIFGIAPENMLFCRVGGDSMVNANIYDGSTLVIDTAKIARNNDIVVISLNNELFVKRIQFNNGNISLISENDGYDPYKIRPDDHYKIVGVVKQIIQNL